MISWLGKGGDPVRYGVISVGTSEFVKAAGERNLQVASWKKCIITLYCSRVISWNTPHCSFCF